jgi:type IV conjugative transfer system coupling protein TraD
MGELVNRQEKKTMQKGSVKNTTRGGQILLHDLHMIGQVLHKLLLWLLPAGLLIMMGWFVLITEPYQRYISRQWLWAEVYSWVDGKYHQQVLMQRNGHPLKVYSTQIIAAPFVQETVTILTEKLVRSAWIGLIGYLVSIFSVMIWLQRRGVKQTAQKHIKGDYLSDVREIKRLIRQRGQQSDLIFGIEKLPLPSCSEMQHVLFHGTTGSGKSTGIKAFLDRIRARGERAIIYDKSCNLVEQFYQQPHDQLMNPLDQRSSDWSLWQECRDKADFDSLAAALIPMPPSTQDPFWINAARTIFAAAAHRLRNETQPKILPLLRHLLTAELSELQSLLKGTEAETLMSEKAEKTAISIKSVLATYLKSLCYIKEGEEPFSIRHWIQDDKASNWLFISSLGDKHESLKPLMTAWLDIAVNALLSLTPEPSRRIWVILDELTSLQQLPYLTAALSEARKFGGCFVIGIQSYAQLAKVYGHEGGREISSLLNTRFMFRVPDPEMAQWSAKNLGETTFEEVREGISYGANSIRDGVSINRIEREKPVVTCIEILRLDDLTCYARLPGNYPITKLHLPYINRSAHNVPFEAREFNQDSLREEVLQLADKIQGQSVQPNSQQLSQHNDSSPSKKTIQRKAKHQKRKQIIDERLFD